MTDSPDLVEATLGVNGSPSPSPRIRQLPLFNRDEVAERICQGALLFIFHDRVINASSWAKSHPGGVLAILHFVGRDATNEVLAYHSDEALKRIEKYAIGRVEIDREQGWDPLTPPITLGLIRHPDGLRGHWKREGELRLQVAEPSKTSKRRSVDTRTSDVVYLEPEQLEVPNTLDRRKEHVHAVAYRDLRKKLYDAGMFVSPGPLAGYGSDIIRYVSLGAIAAFLYFR